ncbi:MAG: hypothetical protein U9Q33_13620 [Campylobacterota bacterium]|nr:hypothetical protein [Campylobacterota bacterium]
MKKVSIISDQIKNNTYSYTGKGSFETVVKDNKKKIVDWLEELIPLQSQIEYLNELSGLEFQKRNYTRILTKLFPKEYTEFVSLNILVRDSSVISQYYSDDFNLVNVHNKLIANKYLKYPGKYDKYVEFDIFQKFVMLYKDDLVSIEHNDIQSLEPDALKEEVSQKRVQNKDEEKDQEIQPQIQAEKDTKKDTNWTNLLLGKLK